MIFLFFFLLILLLLSRKFMFIIIGPVSNSYNFTLISGTGRNKYCKMCTSLLTWFPISPILSGKWPIALGL